MFGLRPKKSINAEQCVRFLKQLRKNVPGNIVVIWDRFAAHRSRKVKAYTKADGKMECKFLPAYAPELNPVETVWSHCKYHQMANFTPKDIHELYGKAQSSMKKIKMKDGLIKQLSQNSELVKMLRI